MCVNTLSTIFVIHFIFAIYMWQGPLGSILPFVLVLLCFAVFCCVLLGLGWFYLFFDVLLVSCCFLEIGEGRGALACLGMEMEASIVTSTFLPQMRQDTHLHLDKAIVTTTPFPPSRLTHLVFSLCLHILCHLAQVHAGLAGWPLGIVVPGNPGM